MPNNFEADVRNVISMEDLIQEPPLCLAPGCFSPRDSDDFCRDHERIAQAALRILRVRIQKARRTIDRAFSAAAEAHDPAHAIDLHRLADDGGPAE